LAEAACNDNFTNETWLNVYGRPYQDLLIIDLDQQPVEIDPMLYSIIRPYFDRSEPDVHPTEMLQGLKELRSLLSAGEYPSVDVAVLVISILKKGMTKLIDPALVTEVYRLTSLLLRLTRPSTELFKQYWTAVFFRLICGDDMDDAAVKKLREKFLELFKQIGAPKDHENQERASSTLLRIICEIFEIDFAFFLTRNSHNASTAMFNKHAPRISSLFWPYAMIHISDLQGDFLKPLVAVMMDDGITKHAETYELYCRFLAMIFEIIRLTEKGETVEAVSCKKTPQTLRRFLTDIPVISRPDVLERLYDSIAFGWVKRAVRARQVEIGDRR